MHERHETRASREDARLESKGKGGDDASAAAKPRSDERCCAIGEPSEHIDAVGKCHLVEFNARGDGHLLEGDVFKPLVPIGPCDAENIVGVERRLRLFAWHGQKSAAVADVGGEIFKRQRRQKRHIAQNGNRNAIENILVLEFGGANRPWTNEKHIVGAAKLGPQSRFKKRRRASVTAL